MQPSQRFAVSRLPFRLDVPRTLAHAQPGSWKPRQPSNNTLNPIIYVAYVGGLFCVLVATKVVQESAVV